MTTQSPRSNPGVRFPPPLIFVGGIVLGWWLDRRVMPLTLMRPGASVLPYVAIAIILAGAALMAWGQLTFWRAHTTIIPHKSASSLVTSGPYRFTRNPMYTGMTIAYLGAAVLINSVWVFLLLPLVLVLLITFVIVREERYLSDAFGNDYAVYRTQVGRWH